MALRVRSPRVTLGAVITSAVGAATGAGAAASVGVPVLYLRPDADALTGGWTASGGGSLFAAIDEVAADDSDYIQSGDDPVTDITKIGLSDSVTTLGAPITAHIRYKCRNAVTLLNLRVRLLQGTTEIASWTYATSTTAVTADEALTAPQIASISDQTDLYFEFTANP